MTQALKYQAVILDDLASFDCILTADCALDLERQIHKLKEARNGKIEVVAIFYGWDVEFSETIKVYPVSI